MIFDRTQSDVDNANAIRENKIKNLVKLTDDEIETLEKGFLTVSTLNRIENKQLELKELFSTLGYYSSEIITKSWSYGDDFASIDFDRIINNENILRNSFFVYTTTPETPASFLDYEDTNKIEKILFDLESFSEDIKNNYRICGDYECQEG